MYGCKSSGNVIKQYDLGFFSSLSSLSRIFHSYGDVSIAAEGLQILNYARHSLPWSSEGSLTCHKYCDRGLLFIFVISEDPWHSHLLPSVWQWSSHYLFLRLWYDATWNRTPISRMRGERSTPKPLQTRCKRGRSIHLNSHYPPFDNKYVVDILIVLE